MKEQMYQQMKSLLAWATPSSLSRFLFCVMLFSLPVVGRAEVFYALDEALELAFPAADEVNKKSFVLTDEQRDTAEKQAQTQIDSRLFTFYSGIAEGAVIGYAAIETQIVRTHPETLLVVLSPAGKVQQVVVLAFHEPGEYLPSEKWLAQFDQRDLSDTLWPGKGIHGIFGSTLSAQATSSAVRKVLALYKVLIEDTQ